MREIHVLLDLPAASPNHRQATTNVVNSNDRYHREVRYVYQSDKPDD